MSSTPDHSRLLSDISNFIKILDYEKVNLDNKDDLNKVQLDNALDAVKDISSLWQAHTTKLALAFKPPISTEAASKVLEESAKLPKLIIAAYHGINSEQDPTGLMKPEVEDKICQLFESEKAFLLELNEVINRERSLLQNLRSASSESNAKTLVSVGQIWESCKKCQELINLGPVGVLQMKITSYSAIIKDAIEEYQELVFEDNEEDNEDNDGNKDSRPNEENNSNTTSDDLIDDFEEFNFNSPSKPISKELIHISSKWNDVFIRLSTVISVLCKVLCKRLANTEASKITQVNLSIKTISEATDDLVFGFSEDSITDVNEGFATISNELQLITSLITQPDDNFSTQLRAYSDKFKSNIEIS